MKTTVTSVLTLFAFVVTAAAADVSTKLSDVHICCKGCVDGAQKAVSKVQGVSAVADEDSESVTVTGPDSAAVQKGVDALVAAGYYGQSSDPNIKVAADTGAKGEKVHDLKVEGVHLCCGKCVSSVNKAVQSVPGATGHTAKKGAKTFDVTGDFNDKDLFAALQKQGLTGKVAK